MPRLRLHRRHRPPPRRLPWKRLCPAASGAEYAGCGRTVATARRRDATRAERWNCADRRNEVKQSTSLSPLARRTSSPSRATGLGHNSGRRQPVEVLASPSSSAPALYGFPAGRPFRVIGREGGFAHIQDLRSSASGWIDEAALARPPRDPAASAPAPAASAPAQPTPFSVGRKPTNPSARPKPITTQKDSAVTQPDRKRPGLFGRGGVFGGIFRNGN